MSSGNFKLIRHDSTRKLTLLKIFSFHSIFGKNWEIDGLTGSDQTLQIRRQIVLTSKFIKYPPGFHFLKIGNKNTSVKIY